METIRADDALPWRHAARSRRCCSALAWPTAVTQIGMMLFGIVDIWMLGRLGSTAIAAAGRRRRRRVRIAHLRVWALIMGIDPVVTQAHGAGRRSAARSEAGVAAATGSRARPGSCRSRSSAVWLQRRSHPARCSAKARSIAGLGWAYGLVAGVVSIPADPGVSHAPPISAEGPLRSSSCRCSSLLFGNVLERGVQRGAHSSESSARRELGIVGAGLATGLSRLVLFLTLWAVSRLAQASTPDAWQPWSRASFAWSGLAHIATLRRSSSGCATLASRSGRSPAATTMAGWLGEKEAAAHVIALKSRSRSRSWRRSESRSAAATRVGNSPGCARASFARNAPRGSAIGFAAVDLGVSRHGPLVRAGVDTRSAPLFTGRRRGPRDGTATALSRSRRRSRLLRRNPRWSAVRGLARGMGTPRPAAIFNLGRAYYGVALPLGYLLAFRADWGLTGIWTGLGAGLGLVALTLMVWIHKRGPATVTDLAIDD